ncbi:hypothetical protein D3C81_2208380 [compost metagenome]
MDLLAESDGLDMSFCDDGAVLLQWDAPTDDDRVIEREVELDLVRHEEKEAPF